MSWFRSDVSDDLISLHPRPARIIAIVGRLRARRDVETLISSEPDMPSMLRPSPSSIMAVASRAVRLAASSSEITAPRNSMILRAPGDGLEREHALTLDAGFPHGERVPRSFDLAHPQSIAPITRRVLNGKASLATQIGAFARPSSCAPRVKWQNGGRAQRDASRERALATCQRSRRSAPVADED